MRYNEIGDYKHKDNEKSLFWLYQSILFLISGETSYLCVLLNTTQSIMKRIVAFLIIGVVAISMWAQAFKAYIQVSYQPITHTVSIIIGDNAIVPKDAKGNPLQFNTSVAVLNWLSKKGWQLVPINNGANTYLMCRDNTTEKQLQTMFDK